jgi:hypothetical protein
MAGPKLSLVVPSGSVEGDDYVVPGASFAGQPTVSVKPAEIRRACCSHWQSGTTVMALRVQLWKSSKRAAAPSRSLPRCGGRRLYEREQRRRSPTPTRPVRADLRIFVVAAVRFDSVVPGAFCVRWSGREALTDELHLNLYNSHETEVR